MRSAALVALVLLLIPLLSLIVSGTDRHFGVIAQAVINALVAGATLATAFLAWQAVPGDHASQRPADVPDLADQLAKVVQRQWEDEADARQLNDPRPLLVRWRAADPRLSADWEALKRSATGMAGLPSSASTAAWACSLDELAGEGSGLPVTLSRIPTRRLMVLGEPGAGKTMLMIRLVLDLLATREAGAAVPVLVSLNSWEPELHDLPEWLASQLSRDLGLVAGTLPGLTHPTVIAELIAARLIVPILDGLDEIPDSNRRLAIARINEAMHPGQPVVVTCRTGAYEDATRSRSGVETILRAAAVEICPLDTDADAVAISTYLLDDAGGPEARRRWAPVIASLNSDTPVGQALTTPLMVGLARATYNVRAGSETEPAADPAELCDPAMRDKQAVQQHLFDAFVSAAYRSRRDRRFTVARAENWLTYLACHLEVNIRGNDLAWWELQVALSPSVKALAVGLIAATGTAIAAGLGTGIAHGMAIGLAAALGAGFAGGAGTAIAIWLMARSWRVGPESAPSSGRVGKIMSAGAAAVGAGIAVGTAAGLSSGVHQGPMAGLAAGRDPAVAAGLAFGIVIYIAAKGGRLPQPARGLRWHLSWASMAGALAAGVGAGLAVGLPYGRPDGLDYGLAAGVAGLLAVGVAAGLTGLPPDPSAAALSPWAAMRRDRGTAMVIGLLTGIGAGVVFAVGYSIPVGIGVGLATGLTFGLIVSTPQSAWPLYLLARVSGALRGKLPPPLKEFLIDAHARGVLRQAGTVYQFRHSDLQHRLSTRPRGWHVEFVGPAALLSSLESEVLTRFPDAEVSRQFLGDSVSLAVQHGMSAERLLSLPARADRFLVVSLPVRSRGLTECRNILQIVTSARTVCQLSPVSPATVSVEAEGRASAAWRRLGYAVASWTGLTYAARDGDLCLRFRRSRYQAAGWDLVLRLPRSQEDPAAAEGQLAEI